MPSIDRAFSVTDGLSFEDLIGVFWGTDDPTSVFQGDTDAIPVGSLFLKYSTPGPKLYQRYDTGDYDYVDLGSASGSWYVGTIPPSPSDGAGWYNTNNNTLYIYDGYRMKWLGTARNILTFGRGIPTLNQYLPFDGVDVQNRPKPGQVTIVGLTGTLSSSGTCDFRIRKNGSASNIATLSLSSTDTADDQTINVDINTGDYLQVYVENSSIVYHPILEIRVAWRY